MNKKFSTLLAGAFLATAFTVNAQVAPDKVKAGEYYYIGTSDSYLTIGDNYNKTAKDSIMFGPKADADLWNVAKAGYKYFLVNPYDSAFVADEDYGYEVENTDSKYLFEDRGWNTYAKAAFVKGIVYGADSLVIVRENATAADTLKNMAVNPAAMAFRTTAATEGTSNLIVESNVNRFYGLDDEDNQLYESQSYFLKVINNVLVWSSVPTDAHLFNVEDTTLRPTSNDDIEAESTVKVIAGNGTVTVQGAAGQNVTIATVLGKVVANEVVSSDNATIAAPAGVVFVTVNGETAKVVVK